MPANRKLMLDSGITPGAEVQSHPCIHQGLVACPENRGGNLGDGQSQVQSKAGPQAWPSRGSRHAVIRNHAHRKAPLVQYRIVVELRPTRDAPSDDRHDIFGDRAEISRSGLDQSGDPHAILTRVSDHEPDAKGLGDSLALRNDGFAPDRNTQHDSVCGGSTDGYSPPMVKADQGRRGPRTDALAADRSRADWPLASRERRLSRALAGFLRMTRAEIEGVRASSAHARKLDRFYQATLELLDELGRDHGARVAEEITFSPSQPGTLAIEALRLKGAIGIGLDHIRAKVSDSLPSWSNSGPAAGCAIINHSVPDEGQRHRTELNIGRLDSGRHYVGWVSRRDPCGKIFGHIQIRGTSLMVEAGSRPDEDQFEFEGRQEPIAALSNAGRFTPMSVAQLLP